MIAAAMVAASRLHGREQPTSGQASRDHQCRLSGNWDAQLFEKHVRGDEGQPVVRDVTAERIHLSIVSNTGATRL